MIFFAIGLVVGFVSCLAIPVITVIQRDDDGAMYVKYKGKRWWLMVGIEQGSPVLQFRRA